MPVLEQMILKIAMKTKLIREGKHRDECVRARALARQCNKNDGKETKKITNIIVECKAIVGMHCAHNKLIYIYIYNHNKIEKQYHSV